MRAILTCFMAFCFSCVAAAHSQASAKHSEESVDYDEKGMAETTLAMEKGVPIVSIELDKSVDRLEFASANVVRSEALEVLTPGLRLVGNAIVGESFSAVKLRLATDFVQHDAKYPIAYGSSDGVLVYLPAVTPDTASWTVVLSGQILPEDWVRWPANPLPRGYLYMGPRAAILSDESGPRFVFSEGVDDATVALMRDTVTRALDHLTTTFGVPPESEPFIAVSQLPGKRSTFVGDVTEDAMIALRFTGDTYEPTAPDALARTRSLILHEGVHFWNGGIAQPGDKSPQWLHERGAEYLAALGSLHLGWSGPDDLRM